ncbi:unnamed protein product, partial [Mesorhabditis spiculigera]
MSSAHFKDTSFPWRHILFSPTTQAIYAANFSFGYCALYLPIHKNGLYTMTPFISQIIFKNVLSWVSDWLKKEKQLDPTKMGKGFQIFSALGVSASLIGLVHLPSCDRTWMALPLLMLYGTAFSASIPGSFTSLVTIAPPYTGTISSIAMAYLTIAGIGVSQLITLIDFMNWPHKWTIALYTGAVLNIFSLELA